VLAPDERVPAAVAGCPQHARPGRGAVHGRGHPAKGPDVGSGLLAPGVPGAVHLVREADDDRDPGAVVAPEQPREPVDGRRCHLRQTMVRLEAEQQPAAHGRGLRRGGVDVDDVPLAQRHLREGDRHGGGMSESVGEAGQGVLRPVDADPEQGPGGGRERGPRGRVTCAVPGRVAAPRGRSPGLHRRTTGQERRREECDGADHPFGPHAGEITHLPGSSAVRRRRPPSTPLVVRLHLSNTTIARWPAGLPRRHDDDRCTRHEGPWTWLLMAHGQAEATDPRRR
jgi:hypothetical protein